MKKFAAVVGGLLLTVIGGLLVNWLTPLDVIGFSRIAIVTFWSFACTRIPLPLWALVSIAFAYPVLASGIRQILACCRSGDNLPPYWLFRAYTSDLFLGVDWHWAYVGNRIDDGSIIARCPRCKCQLDWVQESGYRILDEITLVCPNCGFRQHSDRNEEGLVRLIHQHIDRKIVTGEFKSSVQQPAPG